MRYAIAVLTFLVATQVYAAAPRMTISSPGGGETYVVGQKQTFTYTGKTKFKSLTVEMSRDGGATWEIVGTINNKVKDRNLQNVLGWTVDGEPSKNCVLRMTGTLGPKSKPRTYTVL